MSAGPTYPASLDTERSTEMKIGMNNGQLVALHEGRWFVVGASWDHDLLRFLADGTDATESARALIEAGNAPISSPPSGLPFLPQSLRHFAFWDDHMVNAGRHAVAQFMPRPIAMALAGYERITGRPHRIVVPKANYHRYPQFFMGNHRSIVADGSPVPWPAYTDYLDFELEIAAVVTAEVHDPTPEQAAAAIGGYVVFNDWTARDVQFDDQLHGTFGAMVKSKTFLSSMSAFVITADEFELAGLSVSVTVGDERWVTASTDGAMFTHADALAYAAAAETLRPGDLLTSGTVPRCCGLELARYPRVGDRVRLEVDGIGTLSNTIVPTETRDRLRMKPRTRADR